jgi:hypothetical protein
LTEFFWGKGRGKIDGINGIFLTGKHEGMKETEEGRGS